MANIFLMGAGAPCRDAPAVCESGSTISANRLGRTCHHAPQMVRFARGSPRGTSCTLNISFRRGIKPRRDCRGAWLRHARAFARSDVAGRSAFPALVLSRATTEPPLRAGFPRFVRTSVGRLLLHHLDIDRQLDFVAQHHVTCLAAHRRVPLHAEILTVDDAGGASTSMRQLVHRIHRVG